MARRPLKAQHRTFDRIDVPGGFSAEVSPWAGGTLVSLFGELDLDTVPDLNDVLGSALGTPATVVVVDCAGLDFCDSTGLNALLRAQARAEAQGSRIELARPRPLVLRMLELTGVTEAFTLRDTLPC